MFKEQICTGQPPPAKNKAWMCLELWLKSEKEVSNPWRDKQLHYCPAPPLYTGQGEAGQSVNSLQLAKSCYSKCLIAGAVGGEDSQHTLYTPSKGFLKTINWIKYTLFGVSDSWEAWQYNYYYCYSFTEGQQGPVSTQICSVSIEEGNEVWTTGHALVSKAQSIALSSSLVHCWHFPNAPRHNFLIRVT